MLFMIFLLSLRRWHCCFYFSTPASRRNANTAKNCCDSDEVYRCCTALPSSRTTCADAMDTRPWEVCTAHDDMTCFQIEVSYDTAVVETRLHVYEPTPYHENNSDSPYRQGEHQLLQHPRPCRRIMLLATSTSCRAVEPGWIHLAALLWAASPGDLGGTNALASAATASRSTPVNNAVPIMPVMSTLLVFHGRCSHALCYVAVRAGRRL